MFRVTTASLCTSCRTMRLLLLPLSVSASTVAPPNERPENQHTVNSLYELSVDIQKIRKSKGWVLSESSAFVSETADLLRDMGADGTVIARVLEAHPEAVLCPPQEVAAQRDLWASVCPGKRDLMSIVEKFPASFFALTHRSNQRANVLFLQNLRLCKEIIGELMASVPQCFSRPVEHNQKVLHTLRDTYLDLGGDESDVHTWLQTLLGQNPSILLRPVRSWTDNLSFLREQSFSSEELLSLVSSLGASVAELRPENMWLALAFIQSTLDCSTDELKTIVVSCPAILHYSLPTLLTRFQALMDNDMSVQQVKESPNVLELNSQIVLYRMQKLASYGCDVRAGSLDLLVGTKKDFEKVCVQLNLTRQRLFFTSAAPHKTVEE